MEAQASPRTRNFLAVSYMGRENVPIPYLVSAISRRLWAPEALALCRADNLRIRPHFRPELTDVPWRRRWRRSLGRVGLALALAQQGKQEIDLDAV